MRDTGTPSIHASDLLDFAFDRWGRLFVTAPRYWGWMPNGSYSLAEFPLEMVELACEKCARRGRLLKTKLIEAYGADIALPDLRDLISRCDKAGSMSNPCGAYYVALKPAQ